MPEDPSESSFPHFWAHSDPLGRKPGEPGAKWQPLNEHLIQVAVLAERFALEAGATVEYGLRARACGLLHDLGKYTNQFQRLLQGEVAKAPHSIYGASAARFLAKANDVSFAVAGHHAGMPDKLQLQDRTAKAKVELDAILESAQVDCPQLVTCCGSDHSLLPAYAVADEFEFDVNCRVLLSCLVDADRLDTAEYADGPRPEAPRLEAARRLDLLLAAVQERAASLPGGAVKTARKEVLDACLAAADLPGPLFSLTVPTGGGKTFASMAFALRRAALKPKIRRVIVVIPFLSIIEQNARVYRAALGGDILEHHSAAFNQEAEEDTYRNPSARIAIENWDAPIVITTSVRFFETLFSNHPRDLRRMHNIARSVVILDEVQTLPRKYVQATLSMLNTLAEQWGVTFVFSTATQPALEKKTASSNRDPRWEPGRLTEIIPDSPKLFTILKRVETEWRTTPLTWAQVAGEIGQLHQALVILNTRRHALELFQELDRVNRGAVHLSNSMCPIHRLQKIAEVRERLVQGTQCLVVSTQLVEAGVDLDFPVVWRAMGPLDSIAQAAGRCDREGRLTQQGGRPAGHLVVFEPAELGMPPGVYKEAAAYARTMFEAGECQWDDPSVIRAYFDRLYQSPGVLDPLEIQRLRRALNFKTVATVVNWIDESSWPALVPFDKEAVELIEEIRFKGVSLERFRKAQRYTVNLWERDFQRGLALGSLYQIRADLDLWACRDGLYDPNLGIRLEGLNDVV